MARRADPERIYLARRAALFRNLADRVGELEAEHRVAAWERSDEAQELDRLTPGFWEAAEAWIAAERRDDRVSRGT